MMATTSSLARDELLGNIRAALKRGANSAVPGVPLTARISSRLPGDTNTELAMAQNSL
jgi:hypothetical protein